MSSGAAADPKKRIFIFGAHTAVQRAKGDYISTVYREDLVTVDVGIDGGWMFKIMPDLSAVVTVVLQAQSPSNDVFSARVNLLASGVISVAPMQVLEANGTTFQAAARALPVKFADLTWNDGTEVRAWSFLTGRLTGRVGGIVPAVVTP